MVIKVPAECALLHWDARPKAEAAGTWHSEESERLIVPVRELHPFEPRLKWCNFIRAIEEGRQGKGD